MKKQYIIELLGMDGSGKTSIAEKISSNVYNNIQFHFMNGFQNRKYNRELELVSQKYGLTKREMFSDDLVNIAWMIDLLNTGFVDVQKEYIKGQSIIFDRYILSAKTYSLATTNSDISSLFKIYDLLPQPDIYIYLNVETCNAIKRIMKRGKALAYYENIDYLSKIKAYYENKISNKDNVFIVDANQPYDDVVQAVESIICKLTSNTLLKK